MGILDGIVEWIAEQVMNILDLITTSVLGALGCSMDTFLRYFPAAETMYQIFLALAIGLILLNWVWQLFKNYFMGTGIDAEDPIKLSLRTFMFLFLTFYAKDIVDLLLNIAGTPYSWILTEDLPPLEFAKFNSVITVILGVCANGAVAIVALILVPAYGKGNWNALKDEVEDSADLIFFHPPYHNMIQYSGNIWGNPHPDDLSRCENYSDFLEKLNHCIRKFFLALRKGGRLAILVGDMRLHGKFYSMQHDLMRMGDFESFLVKGQFNCVSDNRTYKKPFIPIVTEYALLLKKTDSFIIPFSIRQEGVFSVQNTDILALTWHHLIRMTMESIGGRGALKDLYALLKEHPKAKKNPHYQERIRATLYEHPDEYIPVSKGYFRLSYSVT